MVSPAASDNDDDNNSTDLPSTPPCLQRLRASTRRAPPPEDDIDESSLREGILNNSSPAVPAVGAAARQRISGSAPLGSSSARIGIRADGSEDGLLVYSESEVFDMIIESATTTSASEEASRRCYRENFPLHEEDVTVASSLSGAEEVGATHSMNVANPREVTVVVDRGLGKHAHVVCYASEACMQVYSMNVCISQTSIGRLATNTLTAIVIHMVSEPPAQLLGCIPFRALNSPSREDD